MQIFLPGPEESLRNVILMGLAAYLAASVNFSIILFKVLNKGDPRDNFSGNAGSVNVARQLGKRWGLLILLLDMARAGAIAQVGVCLLPTTIVPLLGFLLVVGNQKPLFHGFRGGKGVASYLGFTAMISPVLAVGSCLAWVLGYGLFHQPFIGSFCMVTVLGLGTIMHYSWTWPAIIGSGLTMALIFQAHKTNIMANGKKKG
ncbi:MAG: glycerol-3-phosphate acyltransferase [Deltaproteobacteria bacterium]|nr:glycerol-3-phosphate acyltransferase [Deltaproteobacteria bacterium]